MKLIYKLFGISLVPFLVCVSLILALGYWNSYDIILKHSQQATDSRLQSKVDDVTEYFESWIRQLKLMSRTTDVQSGNRKSILRYLQREFVHLEQPFEKLYFIGVDGYAESHDGVRIFVGDRANYKAFFKLSSFVSELMISRDTGAPIILITVPIREEKGTIVGALAVTIPFESVLERFEDPISRTSEVPFLVDSQVGDVHDRLILANLRMPLARHLHLSSAQVDEALAKIRTNFPGGTRGRPFKIQIGDRVFFTFYKDVPSTPWSVVALQHESNLFGDFRLLQIVMICISLAVLAVMLLSSWAMNRALLSPIRHLIEVHKRFGQGDQLIRASLVGRDEISELGRSFNEMADKLKRAAAQRDVAERLAREANLQLLKSVKLASIGELAAGVAHEVNNPLAVVQGNTQKLSQLLSGERATAEIHELVDKSLFGITRIRKIVDELRSFARQQPEEVEKFLVHSSIQDAIGLIRNLLESGSTRLKTHFCDGDPWICGNPGKFQQVIFNLVSNAKDAVSHLRFGEILIATELRDGWVHISVSDNGHGIPDSHLNKVFDPFFTTKPSGKGTGLGLAISHNIISEMGGSLSVFSTPGEQTKFTIALPLTENGKAIESDQTPIELFDPQVFTGHALVVDDDPDVADVIAMILQDVGLKVKIVTTAEEAIRILRLEFFDYLFTDLQIPGTSGGALIQTLFDLHLLPENVFLVTGGLGFEAGTSELVKRLIRGVLFKPFSKSDVVRALQAQAPSAGREFAPPLY